MRASSAEHDLLYRSLAHQTRLAFPAIGAMLQLKKSGLAFGIHIIGYRGTSRRNCLVQHLL